MAKMIAILLTAGALLVAVSAASYAGCGSYHSTNGGSNYHFYNGR